MHDIATAFRNWQMTAISFSKLSKSLKSYKIYRSGPKVFERAFRHVGVNRERLERRQRPLRRRRRQRLHLLLRHIDAPHTEGQGQVLKIGTTLKNEFELGDLKNQAKVSFAGKLQFNADVRCEEIRACYHCSL